MTAAPESVAGHPQADRPLRKNRDFRLLWLSAGFSQLGARMSVVVFPLLVIWHSGSTFGAGVVAFAGLLPMLLVQLPAGVFVDRWDRRRVMRVCDLVAAAGMVSAAVLLAAGVVWLPHLCAVAFLEGTCMIFYQVAERAAVRNVVAPEHLPLAVSRNEARSRIAGMLGQPAGSGLFAVLWWLPFAATAVGHLLSLFGLGRVKRPFQTERVERVQRFRSELTEGLRWLWRQRFLRYTTLLVAVTNFLAQTVNMAPMVVIKETGGSAALVGLVGTVGGVGGVLGAMCGSWLLRRLSLGGLVILDLATRSVLVPAMAFTTSLPLLFAPFAVMSFTGAVLNVGAGAYMAQVVPDEIHGRAMSAVLMTSWGANSAGALAAGVLLGVLSTTGALLTVATVLVASTLLAVLTPSVRRADISVPR